LTEILHIYYLVSYLICFLAVTGFGFVANRRWSFRVVGKARGREWARYFLVTMFGTGLAMTIIWLSVQMGCAYPLATFLSAGLIAPLNFVSHRRYSFGEGSRSR
jgi:putative flippase GtrA